jgi:hypothetical protein
MGRLAMFGGIVFAITACGQRPPQRHSSALDSSAKILAQLDRLESELATTGADNLTNAVLVERHAHAEQIACRVTDEHVQEIRRLDLAQQKKILEKHTKKGLTVASR